ncbi:hypothetical protein EMIT019CA3_320009 [Bacillus pseudomycoides]
MIIYIKDSLRVDEINKKQIKKERLSNRDFSGLNLTEKVELLTITLLLR